MNEKEWMRAKKALDETIVLERVVVPLDANIASGNADFRSFQQKEEKGKILKIKLRNETKNKVVELIGEKDSVLKAKSSIEAFIVQKRPRPFSTANSTSRYLYVCY